MIRRETIWALSRELSMAYLNDPYRLLYRKKVKVELRKASLGGKLYMMRLNR